MANNYKVIDSTVAKMIRGYRFKPKEIAAFEDAIMRTQMDNQTETMMLFFAEALHDVAGADANDIFRVMAYINVRLNEFIELVNNHSFNIDDLRLRVYEKTDYIFAMSEEDREHIRLMLKEHGYDVDAVEAELEEKEAANDPNV